MSIVTVVAEITEQKITVEVEAVLSHANSLLVILRFRASPQTHRGPAWVASLICLIALVVAMLHSSHLAPILGLEWAAVQVWKVQSGEMSW